jgi:predicted phosphate transport protein (TIGR00153 family)
MHPIIDLFAASPMKPMQTHMQKVQEGVLMLPAFFEAVFAQNWDEMLKLQMAIRDIENEADDLKKALRLNLPSGLFMPVSRIDLLRLLTAQDKIVNKAKDIAGLVTGRKMSFPIEMRDDLIAYLARSIDAAKQADVAIRQLDELLETGFKGKEAAIVRKMITKLDQIENDVDMLQIEIRRELFQLEDNLPPVDVMFFYKVIDWIGELADQSQRVGARLEQLLAR